MTTNDVLLDFARRRYRPAAVRDLAIRPLRGGLEAPGIAHVTAVGVDGAPLGSFVSKPLAGAAIREYRLHREVERSCGSPVLPKLLAWRPTGRNRGVMIMEWIAAGESWPWRSRECSAVVLEQLARVHALKCSGFTEIVDGWNYERELQASAEETTAYYFTLFRAGQRVMRRPMLKALRRITTALPEIRRQLVSYSGSTLLHGDAHPGNVIVRAVDGVHIPVLLDWGRARLGSPFEDVCSWIHSLGFWEPEARRANDSLLVHYRRVRGEPGMLTATFREACWLASACNALSGALRYHLAVTFDPERTEEERWTSRLVAADWLRIIRRADACWSVIKTN